jgi:hypothetical protein
MGVSMQLEMMSDAIDEFIYIICSLLVCETIICDSKLLIFLKDQSVISNLGLYVKRMCCMLIALSHWNGRFHAA